MVNSTPNLENIEYSKKLYEDQKKIVQKEQYIQNLLFEEYINNVKCNLSIYDYIKEIMVEAQNELTDSTKRNKKHLNILTSRIKEDFFSNKKIKITDIMLRGYEGYCWQITVKFEKTEFAIRIPIMNSISVDNFNAANCGQFQLLLRNDKCSWSVLITSYRMEDISEFIEEFIDNLNDDTPDLSKSHTLA